MFLINIFIGNLFSQFSKIKGFKEKDKHLNNLQNSWIKMLNLIYQSKPKIDSNHIYFSNLQKSSYKLLLNYKFQNFMYCLIIFNFLIYTFVSENQSDKLKDVIFIANNLCNLIYLMEILMKIYVFGINTEIKNISSLFDMFLFAININLIFTNPKSKSHDILTATSLLKILRIINKLKMFKSVRKLILTIKFSLPQIFSSSALIFIFLITYSLIACLLFGDITEGVYIDDFINFKTFFSSLLLLFKVFTNDGWHYIFIDVNVKKKGIF